jgi:hypothetical protein
MTKPDKDAEAQRARIAVADSIFAWASLEDKLVTFLAALLGLSGGSGMASAIYFAPSNIETRLTIVDRVAQEFFLKHRLEEPFLEEWANLILKINRLKGTRNKLAHASLTSTITGRGESTKRVVRVSPQIYDVQRRRSAAESGQLQGMGPADIEGHVSAIRSLIPVVANLRDLIFSADGPPEPLLQRLRELKADRMSRDRQ